MNSRFYLHFFSLFNIVMLIHVVNTNVRIFDENSRVNRLAEEKCEITSLRIENCGSQFSKLSQEQITVTYKLTCKIQNLEFNFVYGKEGRWKEMFLTNTSFAKIKDLKRLEAETHFVYVILNATTPQGKILSRTSYQCTIYIKPENATAVLGRGRRNVKSNISFTVDGTKSINNDFNKENFNLLYEWECTDSKNRFCSGKNLGKSPILQVPAEFVEEGTTFSFILKVRTLQTTFQTAMQYVYVNNSLPVVINCITNCEKDVRFINPLKMGRYEATCEFDCDQVDMKMITWECRSLVTNALWYTCQKMTQCILRPRYLNFNKTYFMIVYPFGQKNKLLDYFLFEAYAMPKLENCKGLPPEGTPATVFKLTCDYDVKPNNKFEIQIKQGQTVVFSKSGERLEQLDFFVSTDSQVTIKLTDSHDITSEQTVSIKVSPLITANSSQEMIKQILDVYKGKDGQNNSVQDFLRNGEFGNAIQMVDLLSRELARVPIDSEDTKQNIKDIKKQLVEDVEHIPVKDMDMVKSVSGVISVLAGQHKDNTSDSEMAKLIGKICDHVGKELARIVENDVHHEIKPADLAEITGNLFKCVAAENVADFSFLTQKYITVNITTPFPLLKEMSELTFEEYPEYRADDIIDGKINDFMNAGTNLINMCYDTGDTFMTLMNAGDTMNMSTGTSYVLVTKAYGNDLAKATFATYGTTVKMSLDVDKGNKLYSFMICFMQNDPFWSISNEADVSTDVVTLQLADMDAKKDVKNFVNPLEISFELRQNFVERYTYDVAKFVHPMSKYYEEKIRVYQIDVKAEESFLVAFSNISDPEGLEIVVLNMKRPDKDSFAKFEQITNDNNKLFIKYDENVDAWFFLGVRLRSNAAFNSSASYAFSIYTERCVKWDQTSKKWTFACSVNTKSNSESINCLCYHLTTLRGSREYNNLRTIKEYQRLMVVLESHYSVLVLSVLAIIWAIYSILLIYAVNRNESEEDGVCLMADVPSSNRFGYLLIIRTGRKADAGTTSLITIKIYGEYGESQEHVINFPDPYILFLKRGQQDLFVLATPLHLGKLTRIHLWFDCSGMSPSWYCSRIRICDLQTRKWYNFYVNSWLTVEGKAKTFITVPVSLDKDLEKKTRQKKQRLHERFWSFAHFDKTIWRLNTNCDSQSFTYSKRLTMLLSIILTNCTLCMYIQGLPEAIPRDSIHRQCWFAFDVETLRCGIFSALWSYVPHLIIINLFKYSQVQFQSKSERKSKVLPVYVTYTLWIIVVVLFAVNVRLLMIYGIWLTQPSSSNWLAAIMVALLFQIFVIDYAYHIFLIALNMDAIKLKYNYEKICHNVETQRKYLYQTFGAYVYRPILLPFYEKISKQELMKDRMHYRQKRQIMWQVQDLVLFGLYILILYTIILCGKNNIYDILGNQQCSGIIEGFQSRKMALSEVTRMDEVHEYLRESLIFSLQSYGWYGRFYTEIPGMTNDFCNRYLGVVRLRQLRVSPIECKTFPLMEFLNQTCFIPNYYFPEDTANYNPGWKTATSEYNHSRLDSIWQYREETGSIPIFGEQGFYGDGGYVADMGRILHNSLIILNYIGRYNWLDPYTRGLIVEFPIYNVNVNLFHFVTVVIEKSPSGYLRGKSIVQTERIVYESSATKIVSTLATLALMLLIMMMLWKTAMRLYKTKSWYYRDLWYVMDVVITALSFAYLVVNFLGMANLKQFIDELEHRKHNAFVDYFSVSDVEGWMKVLAAFLVAFCTFRLWKLLQFAVIFRTVERTLFTAIPALFWLLVYYIVTCLASGFFIYLLLNTESHCFKDGASTTKTLILLTIGFIGDFSVLRVEASHTGLGYVFIVFYVIFSWYITTVFTVIILINYAVAQEFCFEEVQDYSIEDYFAEKLQNFKRLMHINLQRFRLRGGEANKEEMVFPKSSEQRYMNNVQIFGERLDQMRAIARSVLLRKDKEMNDKYFSSMLQVVKSHYFPEKTDAEIFFKQCSKKYGLKLVEDRRILNIEVLVKEMLKDSDDAMEVSVQSLIEYNSEKIARLNGELSSIEAAFNSISVIDSFSEF